MVLAEVTADEDQHQAHGLDRVAARGAAVTMSGQLIRILVQAVSTLVLARLLAPSDFGLLSMVVALVGVAEILREFGLGSAAIQAGKITIQQQSNLFWINTGLGATFGVSVVGLSWAIATFYGDSRLVAISQVMACTFLLSGIAAQHRAMLNRDMRFVALAVTDVLPVAIGLIVVISLAALGAGYWALVTQQVVIQAATTATAIALTRWLPAWPRKTPGMKTFLKYGANVSGAQLLNYVRGNFDNVWIGFRFGAVNLGFYDRAFELLMLPLNQINAPATKVALPILSRLRDNPESYNSFLLRGQSTLLHIVLSIFSFAGGSAAVLIPIVLGNQWGESVPLFQILAIGGAARLAGYPTYWAALSKNLTFVNLLEQVVLVLLSVIGILIGALWGTVGVAVGVSLVSWIAWPLGLWWFGLKSDLPVGRIFRAGARAILLWSIPGLCALATVESVDYTSRWAVLGLSLISFVTATGVLMVVFKSFRSDLRGIFALAMLYSRPSSPLAG